MPIHFEVTERPVGPEYSYRITYKFDLSTDDVNRLLVAPYVAGEPLVIDGRIIRPSNIDEIRVVETPEPSAVLLPEIERRLKETHGVLYGRRPASELIREGTDRTNEFITAPPGVARVPLTTTQPTPNERRVLIVHGRNGRAARGFFTFMRAAGLEPLEWSEIVRATGEGSPYIGTVLDQAFALAQAVVVLITPDDEVRLREELREPNEPEHETVLTGQARPNVLFEAGMAFGRQPDRTILVQLGEVRPFSDVVGRHIVHLDDRPEPRHELLNRLETAGCRVRRDGTHWLTEGSLSL